MREDSSWKKVVLVILAILVLAGAWVGFYVVRDKVAVNHVSGHVLNVYVKTENDAGVYYARVQLDDGTIEVFQDKDSFWQWKWNSSDVYGQLTDAQKNNWHVSLVVTGWRVTPASWYRNIIRIEEIDR